MSSKHYDIAIIGGSLTARIAAALLAKQGSRVLYLRQREAPALAWFHSSLFLEKLLGTLGGRSCFVAQQPIQVFSRQARITLSNDVPLADELNRELGTAGPVVTAWLEQLARQGETLENLLWENGGLPWPSLRARARFKLLCVRRRIKGSELDAPLAQSLASLPDKGLPLVTDLLQGLSLKRVEHLSRGQAALLWCQALRPENLEEPAFSGLLMKRLDQFHGLRAPLEELAKLSCKGSTWTGGSLQTGGQFTADKFLLGDARWIDLFSHGKTAPLPAPQGVLRWQTSPLNGQLSPLLAERVICGGSSPLRLAIEARAEQRHGLVLSGATATEGELRRHLQAALPFARYTLSAQADSGPAPAATEPQHPLSLSRLPLRIGGNLYCADNHAVLAEMGAAGAALLGWTLAVNLAAKGKPR